MLIIVAGLFFGFTKRSLQSLLGGLNFAMFF